MKTLLSVVSAILVLLIFITSVRAAELQTIYWSVGGFVLDDSVEAACQFLIEESY